MSAAKVSATELSNGFDAKELVLRGATYRLREMSAAEYDDCIKKATGEGDEVDMVVLNRLMILKSLEEPVLDAEGLAAMPYRLVRKLGTAVNALHFDEEKEEKAGKGS